MLFQPTAYDLAFQEVFDRYFNALLFTAYKGVGDLDLAQRIVTRVFAWLRAKRYDLTDKNTLRILYTMVWRACRDRGHLLSPFDSNDDPSWMMTRGLVEIAKVLDTLSPEQRAAVIRYINEGQPADSLAAAIPVCSESASLHKTASSI